MKRKELYNYIREEIINELTLTENNTALVTTKGGTKPVTFKNPSELNSLKSDSNVTSITTTGGQKLKEMARTPNNIKLGDPAKVALVRKLYSGTWKGDMLDIVEKAGEEGISQLELALAVGKKSQPAINPAVSEFLKIGAFSLAKISTSQEEPTLVAPSAEEEEWLVGTDEKDEWEKTDDEDENLDKGPTSSDIKAAAKIASKVTGGKGYAKQLSPEDEEKYTRLKTGIETKISKILALPKAKRASSTDLQVLKTLINRDDVKKLFKSKGVSIPNLVADIIN
jgi:hypothetical protein